MSKKNGKGHGTGNGHGNRSDERKPETIDGQTGKPDPTPRRIDLSSLRDVRLEMALVYRKMDAGSIDSQDGSRRVFVLRQIADVIIDADLERRIAELEERQANALQPRTNRLLPTPQLN
jgi:hypothetical protein